MSLKNNLIFTLMTFTFVLYNMLVFKTRDLFESDLKVIPVLVLDRTNSIFLKTKVDENYYIVICFDCYC